MRTEEYLILDRDDLLPFAKNTPISDINFGLFKSTIKKPVLQANLVIFDDNDTRKIIKSRYIIHQ